MPLQIDGFSVLNSISDNPKVFEAVKSAVEKAAIDLVLKQMKAPSFDLENLKQIEAALGTPTFVRIADEIPPKELPKILKKVDPHFPELATAKQGELLTRMRSLSSGEAEPAAKPAKKNGASKTAAAPASTEAKPRALSVKSMGAKRK
jgi:hypothetical protein